MNDNDIKEREKEIRNDLLETRRKLVIALITVTVPILAMFVSFIYRTRINYELDLSQSLLYLVILTVFLVIEGIMIDYVWNTRKE